MTAFPPGRLFRGIVKWHNDGLQNRSWEFDSLCPCQRKQRIEMSKVGDYVKSSYDELVHKVSWPTFKELQNSAVVVAVAALILALVIFLMDFVVGVQGGAWKGILGIYYSLVG